MFSHWHYEGREPVTYRARDSQPPGLCKMAIFIQHLGILHRLRDSGGYGGHLESSQEPAQLTEPPAPELRNCLGCHISPGRDTPQLYQSRQTPEFIYLGLQGSNFSWLRPLAIMHSHPTSPSLNGGICSSDMCFPPHCHTQLGPLFTAPRAYVQSHFVSSV